MKVFITILVLSLSHLCWADEGLSKRGLSAACHALIDQHKSECSEVCEAYKTKWVEELAGLDPVWGIYGPSMWQDYHKEFFSAGGIDSACGDVSKETSSSIKEM